MNDPVVVTPANFKQVVEDSKVPVLVDFWAPWCAPCRRVEPVIAELASEYNGKVAFAKINVDESQPVASRYGVMSLPTLILFNGGKPARQMVGFRPKAEIKSVVDNYVIK